jgi:hypothetical protein
MKSKSNLTTITYYLDFKKRLNFSQSYLYLQPKSRESSSSSFEAMEEEISSSSSSLEMCSSKRRRSPPPTTTPTTRPRLSRTSLQDLLLLSSSLKSLSWFFSLSSSSLSTTSIGKEEMTFRGRRIYPPFPSPLSQSRRRRTSILLICVDYLCY